MGVLPPANDFPGSFESLVRNFDDGVSWDVVISNVGNI